ncbi:MAG TPA: cupin domain-containing protein [Terriglobia bacterium]|jgi:quercetin dioxygenase-like cupin family protein
MKVKLAIGLLVSMAVAAGAAGTAKVTYVDHAKVAKGGALITAPDFLVEILTRKAPGQVEIHDKETDTFYVLDGQATFVTGGTMIGGKVTAPNQQRGTDIRGGEVHQLSKGDVIAIPAGIPHWFKEVPQPFTYYVVKVIKP